MDSDLVRILRRLFADAHPAPEQPRGRPLQRFRSVEDQLTARDPSTSGATWGTAKWGQNKWSESPAIELSTETPPYTWQGSTPSSTKRARWGLAKWAS